ncbi:MAG: DUF4859 domain-containing protein [Bacteroidaceae bacterium]|nr:DUF4859 domain-containing protein [Bacteroidaceae bacterium]
MNYKLACLAAMMLAGITANAQDTTEPTGESTLKDPVTKLSELTIVKEYEMTLPFVYGKEYENKTVSVTLDGIYDALGTVASDLDANVNNHTLTRAMNTTRESEDAIPIYSWSDDLARPEDLAGGAWFGAYYQETDDGTDPVLVGTAPKGWATGNNTFYTQEIKLNDGEFSIITGQYPGVMKEGDKFESNLYVVNGDKGVSIKLITNVYVPAIPVFADLTCVGDTSIAISAEVNNNYLTKTFNVDIEKVYSLLGCQASDISEIFAFSEEGVITNHHSADEGGFFFNEDGFVGEWGQSATFYITAGGLPNGKFAIGQRPNRFDDLTEGVKTQETVFMFIYDNKYYKVNLSYTVTPFVQHGDDELVLKSTEYITKEIVPDPSSYPVDANTALDLDYVASIIGTKDFKVLTDTVYTNPSDNSIKVGMSDLYNCTPSPGFWYGSTEYAVSEGNTIVSADGWSASSSFGFSYVDGELVWFRYPGTHNASDTYKANIYLVNKETNEYMKYCITVNYVEELTPKDEVVATDESVVFVDESADDLFRGAINTKKVCELLGIENLADVADDVAVVYVKSPTSEYTESLGSSQAYSANGYANDLAEESGAFVVGIDVIDDNLYVLADFVDADNKQIDAVANIGIQYAGKRVMFKVTFSTTDPALSIASARAAGTAESVYSLSGTRLSSAVKGVNIIKMSDGSVRKILK